MSSPPLNVRFYVDAPNLYYRVFRRLNIKWIDLEKLLFSLVRDVEPLAQVEKIFLFAAPVKGEIPHLNQQTYFGALQTRSPCIEIINGEFVRVSHRIKFSDKTKQTTAISGYITVENLVEKRTDVNIGCQITEDAHIKNPPFDACCLVSKDSDMLAPLQIKKRLEQRMFLILPRTASPAERPIPANMANLVAPQDLIPIIRKGRVRDCRLPDKVGKYTKPAGWK